MTPGFSMPPVFSLAAAFAVVAVAAVLGAPGLGAAPITAKVEAEEPVYPFGNPDNGSGPMWCYGSTCVTRVGSEVFVSGLEILPGVPPNNNVRWVLYHRTERGWEAVRRDEEGRTREPCPLASYPDGRLFLSVNPTLTRPDVLYGPAKPGLLEFTASDSAAPFRSLPPVWEGDPPFTEHSYRGMCADGPRRELLLFNIEGHHGYYWSLLNRSGKWATHGKLEFPMGLDYPEPEPIRLCYPVLALRKHAAHMLAISDIVEPIKEWREFKLKLNNGRTWDYEFRRLFYTWTPDITRTAFAKPIEVASREKTAGHITNLDIWLDRAGRAHVLWLDTSVWYSKMRDVYFPGTPITTSLEYCIIDKGNVVKRTTIAKGGEGASAEEPRYARFHATPDGRLFVFAAFSGPGTPLNDRLIEMLPNGLVGATTAVPLAHPFGNFMTATERGGSAASDTLDLLGEASGQPGISYAQIRVK